MRERIHIIAPYCGLVALAHEVNREFDWNIDVKLGNLEDSIDFAKAAIRQDAQAIISRGGTASIIRSCVDIPVIEIEVTSYDILKALYPYHKTNTTIGVIGYRNVIAGCKDVSSILDIPIQTILVPNQSHLDWHSVQNQVKEMIEQYRIDVLVGDTVVISKLDDVQVKCQLITSGKEAVLQAIDMARNVIHAQEIEKEKSDFVIFL